MTPKYTYFVFLLLLLLLLPSACAPKGNILEPLATASNTIPANWIPTSTLPTQTVVASPSATQPPSATPTQMVIAERIPIVEYHNPTYLQGDEVMMTPEWFEEQLRWLSDNGYTTLNSAQLVDFLNGGSYPQKSVVLSFDIGVARHSEYAQIVIPSLRMYGLNAIIFLVANTNLIGDECNLGETFCWSELRSWSDEGLISIESHGIWHNDYTTLNEADQRLDAGLSKNLIEENIGKPVLGFAYPYDEVNPQAFEILKSLGYQFATAGYSRSDRSVLQGDSERYSLPRVYPYSNPDVYPNLSTANGLTFEQMIQDQTRLIGLATLTPTQKASNNQATTMPVTATPTSNTIVISSPAEYISMCNIIDKTADQVLRVYQLNHLIFKMDLSPETQAALPAPVKLIPSCNIYPNNQPRAIVLHGTRGPLTGAITTFQKLDNTSAHYLIDRDGTVIQLVPESLGAYHASCYGTRSICIASCPICEDADGKFVEPATQSIGIELVNAGTVTNPDTFKGPIYEDFNMSFGYRYWDDYPEAQVRSLILLINDIRERWDIPLDMVMGHYRINTNTDPGPALNLFWDRYGNPPRPAIFLQNKR
jgi:N-acetyl-anhydromuramyl-L-alanine amidase AmpD/peptidoglycan/xylan/chitin deacetylase (PgdA/CDA1 family)